MTLAGLCHDLGHPCYSHMFESYSATGGLGGRWVLKGHVQRFCVEPQREKATGTRHKGDDLDEGSFLGAYGNSVEVRDMAPH